MKESAKGRFFEKTHRHILSLDGLVTLVLLVWAHFVFHAHHRQIQECCVYHGHILFVHAYHGHILVNHALHGHMYE